MTLPLMCFLFCLPAYDCRHCPNTETLQDSPVWWVIEVGYGMLVYHPLVWTVAISQVLVVKKKKIVKYNMHITCIYCILSVSSLHVWEAEEEKKWQLFILSWQQVYTVQRDFRRSEAPAAPLTQKVLFACLLAQNYPWVYQGWPCP